MELTPFLFGAYKVAKYFLYPFTWVMLLLTLATILSFMPVSDRQRRWTRRLLIATLTLSLVAANHVVAEYLLASIEAQAPPVEPGPDQHFDAIVVLGGGIYPKGSLRPSDQLSNFSLVRTMCGAELYGRGLAPKLVLSGGDASVVGEGPRESHEMKRLAIRLGVPDEAILIEDQSRTTYENAVATQRLLGPASILLTTSAFHMPRAAGLFRRQGMAVTPYPCRYSAKDLPDDIRDLNPFHLFPSADALLATTYATSELAGTFVYRLIGKI